MSAPDPKLLAWVEGQGGDWSGMDPAERLRALDGFDQQRTAWEKNRVHRFGVNLEDLAERRAVTVTVDVNTPEQAEAMRTLLATAPGIFVRLLELVEEHGAAVVRKDNGGMAFDPAPSDALALPLIHKVQEGWGVEGLKILDALIGRGPHQPTGDEVARACQMLWGSDD